MSRRRNRRAPPDEWVPGTLLDWRSSTHWAATEQPCRYCGHDTHLRDSKKAPAHKVCAETALAQQAADAADAYHQRTDT
ncbi:hypothetical protein [Streptomyces sp. NPDC058045]|uniref:hypothetical protein n=1 Tax=Streptomyces sp. NPDC058045 TaxID=3346311 RepID=UPI0036EB3645